MKSIAVIKPDMGVLSRDRLPLSPFGALSQAFGEELLARAEQTEGAWSYVPLDLLEEGEEAAPPAPPVKPVLQVNLQLVLEALRREGRRTEQQRATERIVERILQMQTRPASRQEKEKSPARTPAQPLSVFGTVRQEFHPTFIQNIRISAPPSSQPKTMGELARKAENFSQRLQTLREEGAPPPQETRLAQGQMVPLRTGEEAPRFTQQADRISPRPLPQEALTLLEEQGETAAQTVSSTQSKALLRRADQLAHQMQEVLAESAKNAANSPAPSGKHQGPSASNQPSRTPQREDTEENQKKGGEPGSKAPAHAPAAQGGQVTSTRHGVSHTTPGETASQFVPPAPAQEKTPHSSVLPQTTQAAKTAPTAARDIRVNADTSLSSVATQEHFGETAKQTMGPGSAAPMVPGSSMIAGQIPGAPAVSGQGAVPPAPLDLSLHTEGEKTEEAEQIFHKTASIVERTEKPEGKQFAPSASIEEKASHSSVQSQTVQTPTMPQTGKTAQAAQTAARDIRVSPDTPLSSIAAQEHLRETAKQIVGQMGTAPMVPGTSMVPGQMPGSPVIYEQETIPPAPLDLSLRTEGEKTEEAEQIFHKTASIMERTEKPKGKQSSPLVSSQEKESHSNIQTETVQTTSAIQGTKTPPTAARDIRVGLDTSLGSIAAQEHIGETKKQTMGQGSAAPMVPGSSMIAGQIPGAPAVSGQGAVPPAPLDLSLRTEGEKAEEVEQVLHKASSTVEKTGTTEGKQSSPPASAQEKTTHSNVQPQNIQRVKIAPTAARDIRVSPDAPLSSIATQENFGESAKQTMGQGVAAPMVPGTSMVPGQMPGAQTVSGQGVVPPAPLDLSLRTEGEKTEEAGQVFHKTAFVVERTGKTEGKQSSPPASAQEKIPHPNVQTQMTQAAKTAQTAATGRQAAQSPHTSRFGTQNHPSPWGPRTAARDIRTGPTLGHTVPDGKGAEAWMAPSLPLTWRQPNQEEPAAQPFVAGQTQTGAQTAAVAKRGTSSMTEPLSLTYGPVQSSVETPPPEPEAAQPAPGEESEFVRSLPDWARRFLKQSRSSPASHTMGVARDIATIPRPEETEDVQWTAPNYRPPQATIAHREKKQEERPKAVQEVHISEAEIQRTADRVYRIIEDRIRLERRRLGL